MSPLRYLLHARSIPLILAIIIMLAGLVLWTDHDLGMSSILPWLEKLPKVLQSHPWLTGITLVALFGLAVGTGLPGGSAFVLAAGYLFGLPVGLLLSLAGGLVGALITLGMVRLARWRVTDQHLRLGWLNRHPFLLLLALRCIPVLPFTLVSIIGSVIRLPSHHYCLATVLGSIPTMALLSLIGARLSAHFDHSELLSWSTLFSDPGLWGPLLAMAALILTAIPLRKRLRVPPSN